MTAFPKPSTEASPAARDEAERIAAGVYLTAPQLAILWTLALRESGGPATAEDQRIERSITKHLPTVPHRMSAVEHLVDLGLLDVPDVVPRLTPWGQFVATVRRPARRWVAPMNVEGSDV